MLTEYRGLICLAICFVVAFVTGLIKFEILDARQQNLAETDGENEEDEDKHES